jgi:hypothetical protein
MAAAADTPLLLTLPCFRLAPPLMLIIADYAMIRPFRCADAAIQ